MFVLIAIIFVLGYAAIALEHTTKVNKAAAALLTGMLVWSVLMVGHVGVNDPEHALNEHLSGIASILFFLLGAMTVVELMDAHAGFQVITDRITSSNKLVLFWMIGFITFFLSAALDNMTTAIVMCALLRKMFADREDLWTFSGMVIIAANAGGAWTPIGDVTTTMLWIGGQVTTFALIEHLLLPSLVCLIVPLLYVSFKMKGNFEPPSKEEQEALVEKSKSEYDRGLAIEP